MPLMWQLHQSHNLGEPGEVDTEHFSYIIRRESSANYVCICVHPKDAIGQKVYNIALNKLDKLSNR